MSDTDRSPSEEDRDTQPPGPPDPLMAIAVRLEGKIDLLTKTADALFLLVQEVRASRDDHEERLTAIERHRHAGTMNGAGPDAE